MRFVRRIRAYMNCADSDLGLGSIGCTCNVTTYASNPLSGIMPFKGWPNNMPLGVNTKTGYNDDLTLEDYEGCYQLYPNRGQCYFPPVGKPYVADNSGIDQA